MELKVGTRLRDRAGYEYEVVEVEIHARYNQHSQHMNLSYAVKRDDGKEANVSGKTTEAMFSDGQLEVLE